MELLGKMPRRVATAGKYAKDFFTRQGELRHIKKLRFWPLERVLTEKYDLPRDEVRSNSLGLHVYVALGLGCVVYPDAG